MIEKFSVKTFKSLEDVTVELGRVNVFIGANGSGKTGLLEALGILSAAAKGQVDDQTLLARGVRLGVPKLYKSAFRAKHGNIPSHLFFEACSAQAEYRVSLWNNLKDPDPTWSYKTESLKENGTQLASRSPASRQGGNKKRGLAALKAVDAAKGPALSLLNALQNYVIFSPTTAVLRGLTPETQPVSPIGLSGGNLEKAIHGLLRQRNKDEMAKKICNDVLKMIDWARAFKLSEQKSSLTRSSPRIEIHFRDRFMKEGRNLLSAYEVSEGALYVLFLAVIAGHRSSPPLCAVDNADHGLNPRLARALMEYLCQWYVQMKEERQILLTTHNPLILDGLLLQDDRVRLFTVSRSTSGRTSIHRVALNDDLLERAERGWSLSRLWVMGHLGGVPNDF